MEHDTCLFRECQILFLCRSPTEKYLSHGFQNSFMDLKIVVGGIVVDGDRMAVVKESKSHIEDLWNLPVGGLEGNEKIVDGARREIAEETGLDFEIEGLVGVYQNPERPSGQNAVKFIFLARKTGGSLEAPEDLKQVKWVTTDEFMDIPRDQLRDRASRLAVEDYLSREPLPLDTVKYYRS